MGSSGGSQNTVSEFKPPEYAQQGWKDFLSSAQNLAQQPYEQYGGMQVAPWNGTQDAAAGLVTEQAMNGSPDYNAARGSNLATSEGAYLGNPYLSPDYVNNVISDNAQTMANAYATGSAADQSRNAQMAGAFGGGGDKAMQLMGQEGLNRQIGQMANQYQLQNAQTGAGDYRSATGQMLGANSQAVGFNQADLANSQAMMGVGNNQNQYVQALLNSGNQNWQNQQQYPQQMLGLLQQALQAASGSGSTTIGSQSGTPNWLTGGLGLGAGLYGAFGAPTKG